MWKFSTREFIRRFYSNFYWIFRSVFQSKLHISKFRLRTFMKIPIQRISLFIKVENQIPSNPFNLSRFPRSNSIHQRFSSILGTFPTPLPAPIKEQLHKRDIYIPLLKRGKKQNAKNIKTEKRKTENCFSSYFLLLF